MNYSPFAVIFSNGFIDEGVAATHGLPITIESYKKDGFLHMKYTLRENITVTGHVLFHPDRKDDAVKFVLDRNGALIS